MRFNCSTARFRDSTIAQAPIQAPSLALTAPCQTSSFSACHASANHAPSLRHCPVTRRWFPRCKKVRLCDRRTTPANDQKQSIPLASAVRTTARHDTTDQPTGAAYQATGLSHRQSSFVLPARCTTSRKKERGRELSQNAASETAPHALPGWRPARVHQRSGAHSAAIRSETSAGSRFPRPQGSSAMPATAAQPPHRNAPRQITRMP